MFSFFGHASKDDGFGGLNEKLFEVVPSIPIGTDLAPSS